uniref:SPRY domain-containing protein n=1 Tax=Meloidogyne incognita TaxID=6306 RepID=A0A914LJE1_MELIC
MNKKIEKINSDHKNEIEEMKDKFQELKHENDQKDEKINSLGEEINKANGVFEKQIGDLTIKLNNVVFKCVEFVKIKNKWSQICGDKSYKCCENKCINTYKPIGKCIKGNGFGNIIDDENIKYINCLEGGSDKLFAVFAENSFIKPQNCFNYTFYYFEIKCKFEREVIKDLNWMNISLACCGQTKHNKFAAKTTTIYNEEKKYKLSTVISNNDIFGCGLVYPPTNKMNYKLPYIFFTQNGKQIGKGLLVKDNSCSYLPCVWLKCCSIEANFGNDLESKPFKYDVSKHFILKEFY